jgi:putative oxidoreductase
MKLGITTFRAAVGAVFFAHGAQKLFGWFGGPGLEGTAQGFDAMGLRPGKRNALLSGVAEAAGGVMLTLGFLTPLASAATIGVMAQAIESVHKDNGFFSTNGGYEFNLTLMASAFAIADTGPGPVSLDHALGTEKSGPLVALAALAAGLAGPRLINQLLPAPDAASSPSSQPVQGDGQPQEEAPQTAGATS